jgi:hypothetical protein
MAPFFGATVIVAPGQSMEADLAPGQYQVAAEIPNSSVRPFYGVQTYEPRSRYLERFYVSSNRQ